MLINEDLETERPRTRSDRSWFDCDISFGPFDPNSWFCFLWNIWISVIVMYNAILIPIRFAFQEYSLASNDMAVFTVIDYITDVFLVVDLAIRFRTMFIQRGLWCSKPDKMAKQYLFTWFVYDLLGTIPFELIFWYHPLMRIWIRLTRFFRIPHLLWGYFIHQEYTSNYSNYYIILKFMIYVFLLCNWVGCLYFALSYYEGIGVNSYVVTQSVLSLPFFDQYCYAFYWGVAILMIQPLKQPITTLEIVFQISIAVTKLFFTATIIGAIAEIFGFLHSEDNLFKAKMEKTKNFMKNKKLPMDIQKRVLDYLTHIWSRKQTLEDNEIMKQLPHHFRDDINLFINGDILSKVPIFQKSPPGFIKLIASQLVPNIFMPDDWIIKYGDVGNDMYMISRGTVAVYGANDEFLCELHEGDFFGEIVLLLNVPRTASVKARTYCDIFELSRNSLLEVLNVFPDYRHLLTEQAEKRMSLDLLRLLISQEKYFQHFSSKVQSLLVDAFKETIYTRNTVIQVCNDSIYFIGRGSVSVKMNDEKIDTLTNGCFLGLNEFTNTLIDEVFKVPKEITTLPLESVVLHIDSKATIIYVLTCESFLSILDSQVSEKESFLKRLKTLQAQREFSRIRKHLFQNNAELRDTLRQSISRHIVENKETTSPLIKSKRSNVRITTGVKTKALLKDIFKESLFSRSDGNKASQSIPIASSFPRDTLETFQSRSQQNNSVQEHHGDFIGSPIRSSFDEREASEETISARSSKDYSPKKERGESMLRMGYKSPKDLKKKSIGESFAPTTTTTNTNDTSRKSDSIELQSHSSLLLAASTTESSSSNPQQQPPDPATKSERETTTNNFAKMHTERMRNMKSLFASQGNLHVEYKEPKEKSLTESMERSEKLKNSEERLFQAILEHKSLLNSSEDKLALLNKIMSSLSK